MSFFKSWKFKILFPIVLIGLGFLTKFILWDFSISNGKRVGNLVKVSHKGKFSFTKTWEGTIDEGSGDKLTYHFSIRDEELAQELYNYEGKKVVIYYEEYLVGWPRETKYNAISWKAKDEETDTTVNVNHEAASGNAALSLLEKSLFCSLLGTLFTDEELYAKVKNHIKVNNLYLFKQIARCNE